jgi:DNA-binding transcriptional ArsR family regulator
MRDRDGTIELLAKLFCGFADMSRLSILEHLSSGELTVTELVERTGLTQSNLSNHLCCLKKCGLVASRQDARFSFYAIKLPKVKKLIVAAKALLVEVNSEVDKCKNYKSRTKLMKVEVIASSEEKLL